MRTCACSTARRSRRSRGARSACGSAAACSTTAASIIEQSLTTIGDDVTLNMASELQAHSLENGVFKSDHIVIGDGCTIGVGALVNYGDDDGTGSILEADSFLMKGSEVPAGARWRGNPAEEVAVG